MGREDDPRIKRAEDKHTEFEAEKMQAQEAIDARRAADATRRGGGGGTDTPQKLQHPAHQVLSGTLTVKSLIGQLRRPQVGPLRRPQVGLNQRPQEKMALPVLPRLALSVLPRQQSSPTRR